MRAAVEYMRVPAGLILRPAEKTRKYQVGFFRV